MSLKTRLIAAAAVVTAALTAAPRHADAEVGVGLFIGEPLGFTVKIDLSRKTALEFLLGADDWDEDRGRDGYFHTTFLAQLAAVRSDSVIIPFRLGIGGAIYEDEDDFEDDFEVAVRAPFQVAFRFTDTPIELYFEVALRLELIDNDENDRDDDVGLDAGIGFRVYF